MANRPRRLAARLGLLLRRSSESLVNEGGTREAAQVAYFLVMSFPAILLLLVWSFSNLLGDDSVRSSIVDWIVESLPLADQGDRLQVEALLDDVAAGAGSVGWIGAIALLYSASAAIGGLRYAVTHARGERALRPWAPGKAIDVGVTLAVAPVLIAALGLTLSGSLAETIGDRPFLVAVAQFAVTKLVPLALLLAVLTGLYRVLSEERPPLRAALLGGAVAVVGVVLVQLGAEAYFAAVGDRSAVYGTLGVLLAVVFSAYLDAIAVVFGAHVAAQAAVLPSGGELDRTLEAEADGPTLLGRLRALFVRS
jgi:membrane protein